MRNLKSILVALDGSPCSYHALEESIHLAHWSRAGLNAITVAPPYEGDLSLVGVKDIKATISGPYEEILDEAMAIAEMYDARMNVIREEGETWERILHHAERKGSDMIVLGARRNWSLPRAVLGSVTSRIIENSGRDILTIPEGVPLGWGKILLIADGSECGRSSVALAAEVAASYGSELKVLPGEKSGKESIDELKAWAKGVGIACQVLERRAFPYKAVGDLAREQGVELTILGLQTKRGLKRLIMGSPPERLISSLHCPALVVKAHHERGSKLSSRWLSTMAPGGADPD